MGRCAEGVDDVEGLLKPSERLVCVGRTALRAPDGKPLENAPQYMIVPADKANPAAVAVLRENERLILAGMIYTDHRAAEERYAALQEGREYQPPEDGTPLYIIEAAENVNRKTGLTELEEKSCDRLLDELIASYGEYVEGTKRTAEGAKVCR